jgi:subtilase family serine protease
VWARLGRDELGGSPLTIGLRSLIEGAAIRGLALSREAVAPWEEVTVSAEVTNVGESEEAFTLAFEVDGEAKAVRTLRLGAGQSRLVNFTLSLDTPGVYLVGVGGFTVPLTVVEPDLPDLTVSGVIAPEAIVGAPLTMSFSVPNAGEGSSGAFKVSLLVDDVQRGEATLGPLPSGASGAAEFTWTPGAAGTYRVRVVVDVEGAVREANEGNNELAGVVEAAGPAVESEGSDPDWLAAGVAAVAAAGLWMLWKHRRSSLGQHQRPEKVGPGED